MPRTDRLSHAVTRATRTPSRAALVADLARVTADRDVAELSARLVFGSTPDAVSSFTFDGAEFSYHAYGLARPDGGIVAITFRMAGQSDTIDFVRFPAWCADYASPATEKQWAVRRVIDLFRQRQAALLAGR